MAKKMNKLEDLFVDTLKDLYSAENQLVKALPKMAKAAHSEDLKRGFQEHLEQTKEQVRRIEEIFAGIDASPRGKKCVGMEGLIKEGEELIEMKGTANADVLDAGLIAAAQKVEHYEIATYGTARTYAEMLGNKEGANLLQKTLEEESKHNERLTKLAVSQVNEDAK